MKDKPIGKSSKRLVYFQSHGHLTGTIPAGVSDDADDGGGNSKPSKSGYPDTNPTSHTPVRNNATLSNDGCHPQSNGRPLLFRFHRFICCLLLKYFGSIESDPIDFSESDPIDFRLCPGSRQNRRVIRIAGSTIEFADDTRQWKA